VHLGLYLQLLHRAQLKLADAFGTVAEGHRDEADVFHIAGRLRQQCLQHADAVQPFLERYEKDQPEPPDNLHSQLFGGPRTGGLGLLRDLHDLYLMTTECDLVWEVVGQAARGARDEELVAVVQSCEQETAIQMKWVRTQMKQAAPQALVVA
jgi:hypothetical protein